MLRHLAIRDFVIVDRLELAKETVDPSGRAVDVQVTSVS